MHSQLLNTINQFIPLDDENKAYIKKIFKPKTVSSKTILCAEGSVSKEIYFINKGIVRLYYNHEGNDITVFLFEENLFCSAHPSFLSQKPSKQILETLEDCELLSLSKQNLEILYSKIPLFNVFTRKLAEQRFLNVQNIFSSHILEKPEQRYANFAKNHPQLLLRVPQRIIASFLGITPVSLSRIRARKIS